MLKSVRIRSWILVLCTLVVTGLFVARLMQIQLVEAPEIRRQLSSFNVSTQTVRATRGEILDRNGKPLAVNRMGYDVIIDKAFLPSDQQNEIISNLIDLFESLDEAWIDNLPISANLPFRFLPASDSQMQRLERHLNLGSYATADDALYWLAQRYGLQNYPPEIQRQIAGVRYEMEQRDFALSMPYTFATDVAKATVIQVKERSYELLGIDVAESAVRSYPDGTVAPHIIGTIGPIFDREEYLRLREAGYAMDDVLGRGGVELAFEDVLRGQNGVRQIYVDARGKVDRAEETQPPIPGHTLVLTIDSDLHNVLYDALERQILYLREHARPGEGREAEGGAAVVIDVKTGDLLAAVTYPSYDLNLYRSNYALLSSDPEQPLFNRAIHGGYAPGSVFKQVVATAGLARGVVDPHSPVFCGRVYTHYTDYQPTCLGYHGNINAVRALQVSCNIYFYDVGRRVGIDAIADITAEYGLGRPTGIEISENIGIISSPESKESDPRHSDPWVPGDVLQSSIGQLYHSFTPLQMANYTATVANRGQRMKVNLVKEVRDYSQRNVITTVTPEVAGHVDASPEVMGTVVQGMVNASRIGTASRWFGNYPINVASKTGTPQTWDLPNSTFVAFAPAEDPQIAIAVVIEKGWHGYTGAPVARDIFNYYFGFNTLGLAGYPVASTSEDAAENEAESEDSTNIRQ